jgi:hypothetical protein
MGCNARKTNKQTGTLYFFEIKLHILITVPVLVAAIDNPVPKVNSQQIFRVDFSHL